MTAMSEPRRRIPEWSVADRLRKIRREYLGKMTQAELAELLEMSTAEKYAAWESGRTNPPHRELAAVAQRIELLTGVPAAWVLGVDEPVRRVDDTPSRLSVMQPDKVPYHATYQTACPVPSGQTRRSRHLHVVPDRPNSLDRTADRPRAETANSSETARSFRMKAVS